MKRLVIALMLFVVVGCGKGSDPTAAPTKAALLVATATQAPAPTDSPAPTATATRAPTATPVPTATATALPTMTPTAPPTATAAATPTVAAPSSEPAEVVEAVFGAVTEMNVEPAITLFCEAKAPEMAGTIESGFGDLLAMGLDPEELVQAFNIDLQDMAYQETSRDGDAAVVHIAGTLRFDFKADVLKEVIKKVAEANGQPLSDQELDFVITLLSVVAQQGTPLDADVQVVMENGQWVVCDDLLFLGDMFELPFP